MMAMVTAYTPGKESCGKWSKYGKTSTGRDARNTVGVAVCPKLIPYGSMVSVSGIGVRVADDTGGAMRRHGTKGIVHIDVRMHSVKKAREFGKRWLPISVLGEI